MERNLELEDNARGLVVRFIESLSQNDLKSARNCVNDDFEYISPLGNYDRAEPFFKRMEASPLKFNIKKTFVDGNEVCVFVDVPLGSLTLLACGRYTVEEQKIRSLNLIYDPRVFLEGISNK